MYGLQIFYCVVKRNCKKMAKKQKVMYVFSCSRKVHAQKLRKNSKTMCEVNLLSCF